MVRIMEVRMKLLAVSILAVGLAVGLCACGKKEAPKAVPAVNMETPRGTADGLILAFQERSTPIALSTLPPDDVIKKNFDCPNDELVRIVKSRRDVAPKNFGEAPKDMTIDIGAFDKSGSSDQQLRPGDVFEGCKAKTLISIHNAKIDLRVTKDGQTKFEESTWTFLKFGEEPKWYYLR
jgi:hypothetical protein